MTDDKRAKETASTDGVTRRDFLNSTLLASGAILLDQITPAQLRAQSTGQPVDDFTGYGGRRRLRELQWKHARRRQRWPRHSRWHLRQPDECQRHRRNIRLCDRGRGHQRPRRSADLPALANAHRLNCLVLENHPIFGGEAKQNDFDVEGQRLSAHQGSAVFWIPYPYSFIGRFYDSIGLRAPRFSNTMS